MKFLVAVPLLLLGPWLTPAAAQAPVPIRSEQVDEAIEKGKAWLLGRQASDGYFRGSKSLLSIEASFPMGVTSLCALALLKCRVDPESDEIKRAFDWLYRQPFRNTYCVSMFVLAIEARYQPEASDFEEDPREGYASVARASFERQAPKLARQKLEACVKYLLANRYQAVWRYPGNSPLDKVMQDNSNTQYAMLALKAAHRLGVKIPSKLAGQVADYFVAEQDPKGEEVEVFDVPAADGPIMDTFKAKKRDKAVARAKKTRTKRKMRARGWTYLPRAGTTTGKVPTDKVFGTDDPSSTGSMTASGVAALCIAKSMLEESPSQWRKRRKRVDQAIRDGCAWLSKHFRVDANPMAKGSTPRWKYYYLYGLERSGVLAGTYRFGGRDWWNEGARHILKEQKQSGEWPSSALVSSTVNTSFAVLFLRRATIPLVPLPPKRVMTHVGRRFPEGEAKD